MKRRGGTSAPLTEQERQIVEDFIKNDLSYDEMANKVGLTKAQLRYRVAKYRKERKANEQTEQAN